MYNEIKKLIDFLLSFFSLILLSPFLFLLSIIIKVDSPGPVLFSQKRIGKNKEIFKIYKFRTMRVDAPQNMATHIFDDASLYITKSGRFLRKTSLDELPQLINILKGEMSFVGPRPALWNQYDLIAERDKYDANNIHPGLTGWAQVSGRDELEIEKKAELDGEYVQNKSFLFDLKCFMLTFVSVFKSDGVVEGSNRKNRDTK